jgi:methionyl-tRNA formyltransferase
MRLIFMGTPAFALPTLEALRTAGHCIAAVYTQPARPAGRGKKLHASPVATWAHREGLPVETPLTLKNAAAQATFATYDADIVIVAAYGLLLPKAILEMPRFGCLNVHASLLPRWRGASPIQRAILAGDVETGITIMQMEEGLDTGAMLRYERVPILPDTNAGALEDALANAGAALITETLALLPTLRAVAQSEQGMCYAAKIEKAETRLDWSKPALTLERQIRAFAPTPGAWCETADGVRLKILEATTAVSMAPAHQIISCGEGSLWLKRVQAAGKKEMTIDDYQRGQPPSTPKNLGLFLR